jgi:hypothetical protein
VGSLILSTERNAWFRSNVAERNASFHGLNKIFYSFRKTAGSGTINGMTSPPDPASADDVEVQLAEYASLRTEIERRTTMQWNAFTLQFAATGAITSIALSTVGNLVLLLVIPVSSYLLGNRYILHDFHIKLIRRYLRDEHGLRNRLGWEPWRLERMKDSPANGGSWVSARWNFLHPTRMAFEGAAVLALAAMVVLAAVAWVPHSPNWTLLGLGGAGWVVAAGATAALHRSFERAGGN